MKSVKKLLLAASAFAIFGLGIFGGVQESEAQSMKNPCDKEEEDCTVNAQIIDNECTTKAGWICCEG